MERRPQEKRKKETQLKKKNDFENYIEIIHCNKGKRILGTILGSKNDDDRVKHLNYFMQE